MQHIRKSQMEILGLAFVFIILIFGLIIFLRFSVNDQKDKSMFTDPQQAASIISSMLKTSVECGNYDYSVTNLLRDCAMTQRIDCDGNTSCYVANETITQLLHETLAKYSKSYSLIINSTSESEIISNHTSTCGLGLSGISYTQPFDISGNTLYIKLRICNFI